MGLTRQQARFIANLFIYVGIWLSVSLFFPDPSDILIAYASDWLKDVYNLSFDMAYLLWHTVIAWALILIGIWIFPYNTHNLFNGYINKAKRGLIDLLKHPFKLLIGLYLAYQLFLWLKTTVVI